LATSQDWPTTFQLVGPFDVRLTHLSAVFPVAGENVILVVQGTYGKILSGKTNCFLADLWSKVVYHHHHRHRGLFQAKPIEHKKQ